MEPYVELRRTLAEPLVCSQNHVRKVVKAADQESEVDIGTGASTMMTGPLRTSPFELEHVEDANISFSAAGYSKSLKRVAHNVAIEAFGPRKRRTTVPRRPQQGADPRSSLPVRGQYLHHRLRRLLSTRNDGEFQPSQSSLRGMKMLRRKQTIMMKRVKRKSIRIW